jgi:outer membrane lipoprotein-sorting protein
MEQRSGIFFLIPTPHSNQSFQKKPQSFFEDLTNLEEYDVKLLEEEKVNGRDCYVIEATPKKAFLPQKKPWIDKETFCLVRLMSITQTWLKSGTIEIKDVEYDTGISDSEFEPVLPEEVEVVEMN